MSVILITANFKCRNRSTCSKGPIKRAGKVFGDSQDLKSPGSMHLRSCVSGKIECFISRLGTVLRNSKYLTRLSFFAHTFNWYDLLCEVKILIFINFSCTLTRVNFHYNFSLSLTSYVSSVLKMWQGWKRPSKK